MKLDAIKPNPDNPRVLRDERFKKLKKSLEDFPEMMEKRPIVVDEDGMILGGNMRWKALQDIYGKAGEVPDSWVSVAKGWSDEQKRQFVIKDNASFGEWDLGILQKWDLSELEDWGVDIKKSVKDMTEDEFSKTFNGIKDDDAFYPIVPKYDEKHEVFIIVSDSEVDANYLRERLSMNKMRSYKNGKVSKSNIIHIKDVISALNGQDSNSKPQKSRQGKNA